MVDRDWKLRGRRVLESTMDRVRQHPEESLALGVILLALTIRLLWIDFTAVDGYLFGHLDLIQGLLYDHQFPLVAVNRAGGLGHYGAALIYLLAPFFMIFPSVTTFTALTILFNILSVYLIFRIGRDYFSKEVAWIALILYAFSWFTLLWSRGGYPEVFVPFFSILSIYGCLRVARGDSRFVALALGGLAMVLQLAITAYPLVLVVAIAMVIGHVTAGGNRREGWKNFGIGIAVFLVVLSPYIIFEVKQGFAETKMRFGAVIGSGQGAAAGIEIGGKEGLAGNVRNNLRELFLFSPDVNPFGMQLDRYHVCGDYLQNHQSSIISFMREIKHILTKTGFFSFVVSLLLLILLVVGKMKVIAHDRSSIAILLTWLIGGWGLLLVLPYGATSHATFVFPAVILSIALFLSALSSLPLAIRRKRTRLWSQYLRRAVLVIVIIYGLLSGSLYLLATGKGASEACTIHRGSNMIPLGTHLKIEEEVRTTYGTVPWIFQYDLGDAMYFVNRPRRGWGDTFHSEASRPVDTLVVIREDDLPFKHVRANFQRSVDGYRVIGLSSTTGRTQVIDRWEDGWMGVAHDSSGWRAVQLPHEFCIGNNDANACEIIDEYSDFFLRASADITRSDQGGRVAILMLLDGPGHKIDSIYLNGNLRFQLNWSSVGFMDGKQVLLEVTDYLKDGENLIAVKAGLDPHLNRALTNNLMMNLIILNEE